MFQQSGHYVSSVLGQITMPVSSAPLARTQPVWERYRLGL
jgi:hypothetical protein